MRNKYSSIYRLYRIYLLLVSGYLSSSILFAGNWTDHVPQFPGNYPTNIVCRDMTGNQLAMVNEFGEVWVTGDAGYFWKSTSPVGVPLNAVEIDYGIDTVIIVGGQGGNIYRSTNFGESWTPNTLGSDDIRTIVSDGSRFWAGGNAGALYFSPDRGQSWTPAGISRGPMDIVEIIPTVYGIYIAANLDTTAFILADDNADEIFDPVDSLANAGLTSAIQKFGKLYFAGADQISSSPVILLKEDFGGAWGPAIPYFPPIGPTGIADIEGLSDTADKLWMATIDGKLYESDPQISVTNVVYENFSGDYIRSIATTPISSSLPLAWAAGTNGLMLNYDFVVVDLFPYANDYLDPSFNKFDIRFSSIPDLVSIEKGVFIHSTIRGLVPFSAFYNPGDSTLIELYMANGGAVPGELFTIILTNVIKELNSPNRYNRMFSYQAGVSSMAGGDFSFTAPSSLVGTGTSISNMITGFFNDDEYFDLATFTDSEIIFYAGQNGGGFAAPVSQPMAGGVKVDQNLVQQIKKADFNLDGKPDLILYDRSNYQVYTNNSNAGFSFSAGSNQFTNNLTDIEFASVDHDSTLDMIMLNDSLQLRTHVSDVATGATDYAELNSGWDQLEVGDIDNDGFNDLMILTASRELVLRHGTPKGGFDMSYTIPGNFDLIKMGEIKNNGSLELLASEDSIIHLFEFLQPWNFNPLSIIFQNVEDRIESFGLDDFNGDHNQDIILATSTGEFKIFINMGSGFFEERPEHQKLLDLIPTGMTRGDFDQDGALDFVFFNGSSGDFQVINSVPGQYNSFFNFDSIDVGSDQVYLQWIPYEPQGDLNYYNIYRGPDTTSLVLLGTSPVNNYTDSTVVSGDTYWYRIEAVDIFATPHFTAQIMISIPRVINGTTLTGILDDPTAPYLIKSPIEVPQDSLLQIRPGVKILFEANSSLTVYGNLLVQGNSDQFVSFRSAANDTSVRWDGIIISALVNTDTVYMSWFDIEGANAGLRIENRPVDIEYAGISRNRTGFDVRFPQGSLRAEHLIVNKNNIGIHSYNSSKVDLKNITLIENRNEALIAENTSTVQLKNAIIWGNNLDLLKKKTGPDIRNVSTMAMNIQYSTVDSLTGLVAGNNISRIPPLFQIQNADSMDYIPDPLSATIDAGDPLDDFSQEPQPNGGRVNQGVYGGSPFATPSLQPQIGVRSDTLHLAAQSGASSSKSLVVRNKGFAELRIDNLEFHKAEFNYFSPFPQFIQPGDSIVFNITFSPPGRGDYSDTILIQSNDPHFPFPGKPYVLSGTGLNRPPRITTTGLINGVQNFAYRDSVRAVDDDGDVLVYHPLNIPPWMSVATNGRLTGIPTNSGVGINIPVVIKADDGFGGFDTLQTTINVLNVNDPPFITTSSLKDAIEDRVYVDTVFAVDIDKDTLSFSGLKLPAWLKIAPDGALTGLPGNDDVGTDTPVEIVVTDRNGTFDTLFTSINVINTNDPPEFKNLPDTVAYAFIPFEYDLGAIDIDGDVIRFSDDSPLFVINPDSGIIRFTPALSDTGTYTIIIGASDQDTTVTDTFQLRIDLTPLNAIPSPVSTPFDQEIKLEWTHPDNLFYTGTIIAWSDTAPITDIKSARDVIDSIFVAGTKVQIKVRNLEIASKYYFAIVNYYDAGIRIYSDPVQATATTLAPEVLFDNRERIVHVPPGSTLDTTITIRNGGGGTMLMRFDYISDILLDRWFKIDTTLHTIAPFDSVKIPMQLSPLKSMADIDHKIAPVLLTNEPGWTPQEKPITLRILFDKYPPRLSMLSQPDTVHQYTAVRFEFTANDTVDLYGWEFGTPTDSLRVRYKFVREAVAGEQILKQESGLALGTIDFYPLPDGLYRFELWVYDSNGNGLLQTAFKQRILVASSSIPVAANRWYLTSFPRKTDLNLFEFFSDSSALIYRWNNDESKYISFVDSTLDAGEGIWLLSYKPRKFNLEKIPVSIDSDSVVVNLSKGWNQVGIPTGYHLNLADVKFLAQSHGSVLDIREAVAKKLIAPAVYWYRSSALLPGYQWSDFDTTIASPWRGYWVLAAEPGQLILPAQPAFPKSVNINRVSTDTTANRLTKLVSIDNWQVALQLTSDKYADNGNIIGMAPVQNSLPVYEPPHLDRFCAAYFNSDEGRITRDLRSPFESYEEVKTWDLVIESSSTNKEHVLSWVPSARPDGIYLYLIDPVSEIIIDMSDKSSYAFGMQGPSRVLKVYATQNAEFEPQIVPLTFRLDQNYPNPFNPVTTIRFGVPENSSGKNIQLKIFNVLGQVISTLLNGEIEPGYHEIQWNGTNDLGTKVASGVYFYRVSGAGQSLVKKMVLIK